jgi:hypothetical protein
VLTVSITVAYQQTDIPKEIFDKMKAWLSDDCPDTVAGVVAVERGGVFGHEHLQGVAKVFATTPQQVNIMIKAAVGWQPLPKGAVVSVRKCTGRALHTFHGLIGYCFKDEGQSWFQVHLYNVGDEDIERGKEEYLKYGAGDLKKRTPLTPSSVFAKAAVYYQLHARGDRNTVTFQQLLLEMMRTGKYFPVATWVIPFQGRGMSHQRAAALWKMYTNPAAVEAHHVHEVFFHNGEQANGASVRGYRYFTANTEQDLIERWFGNAAVPGEPAELLCAAATAQQHAEPPSASAAVPCVQVDKTPLYTREQLPPRAAQEQADMDRFFWGVRAKLPVGDNVPAVVARLHSVLAPPDMQQAWRVVAAAAAAPEQGAAQDLMDWHVDESDSE